MKKLLILVVLGMMGVTTCFAQAETLSPKELEFRNGISQFLKVEGYVPSVDKEDNSLEWKKEGTTYWLNVYGSSPTYIELHKSGFGIEDSNRRYLLQACNKAMNETRCAKAYVTKSSVAFTIELYCQTVDEFKLVFNRSVSALDAIKDRVKKYYNELED